MVALKPDVAQAFALFQRGDIAGAELALAHELAQPRPDFNALNLSAMLRHQQGDLDGALSRMKAALEISPRNAGAYLIYGDWLQEAKRFDDAVAAYDRSLALRVSEEAHRGRGAALLALGNFEAALASLDAALAIKPSFAAYHGRGVALGGLELHGLSLASFDAAVGLAPSDAGAHFNRGKALSALDRSEEALAAFDASLALDPSRNSVWNARGLDLARLGRVEGALASYERALAEPGLAERDRVSIIYNKAWTLLASGAYEEGFALYDARFENGAAAVGRDLDAAPLWNGEEVEDPLWLLAEQGVGDQVLFLRLLPRVLERTPRVAIECDPRLQPLLQRAFPNLEVVRPHGVTSDCAVGAHIPMGSVARAVGWASRFSTAPILLADPERAEHTRARYEALAGGKPIIGIAWASPQAPLGASKSFALEQWAPLLRDHYFFVSLQYGDASEEIASVEKMFGCTIYQDPEVDQLSDLEPFAAQLSALDYFVSSSNTAVHVAGGLGIRGCVLLPVGRGLHWYWGLDDETTPWHPSLRLIRRKRGEPVAAQVEKAVAIVRAELNVKP